MRTSQYDHVNAPTLDAQPLADAAALLKALGHPLRLGIAQLLREEPRCVHELTDALGVEQPLVSQHLRVLRGARVVAADRRGREVVYRLEDEHVGHIVADAIHHVSEGDPHVHH
jgi:DNA-binding transcriptional ArsR family regulator